MGLTFLIFADFFTSGFDLLINAGFFYSLTGDTFTLAYDADLVGLTFSTGFLTYCFLAGTSYLIAVDRLAVRGASFLAGETFFLTGEELRLTGKAFRLTGDSLRLTGEALLCLTSVAVFTFKGEELLDLI